MPHTVPSLNATVSCLLQHDDLNDGQDIVAMVIFQETMVMICNHTGYRTNNIEMDHHGLTMEIVWATMPMARDKQAI